MFSPLHEDEIRILSLPPTPAHTEGTPQIECDVHVASLSDLSGFPKYETLSYVWGAEKGHVPIVVAGNPILVSQSLYSALRRLQLPDRNRVLWIDQLCIDQQNIDEKTRQVQLMSAIYTKCSSCIAWIGEVRESVSSIGADSAVQLLQYMATANQAEDPSSTPFPPSLPTHFGAAIKGLKTIAPEENQWWNRIWTVQEAALPEHVILQWGSRQIPWSVLQHAREAWVLNFPQPLGNMLGQHPAGESVLSSFMAHVTWLNLAKERFDDLFQMIHRYRFRLATDPRDKIYGLLGLCDRGRLPVTEKCDYSIPVAQVFSTLTQELIIDQQGLRPLTNIPRQQPSESTPGIPSWALDLDHSNVAFSPDVYYLMHGYDQYNAAEGLGQIDLEAIKAQLGQKGLSLIGAYVDNVARVQEGHKTNSVADPANIYATEALLQKWYATAMGYAFHLSDGPEGAAAGEIYPGSTYTLAEAFARFVLGDVIRDGEQAPSRDVEDCDIQDIWKIMRGQADEVDFDTRRTVYGMMANQYAFVTESGLFGCGHTDTEVGDEVWVFRGGNVPFTIRPRKAEDGRMDLLRRLCLCIELTHEFAQ